MSRAARGSGSLDRPLPWVKICGVTRPEDAALAARLGAAFVGVNFWPGSKRRVELSAAREIAAAAIAAPSSSICVSSVESKLVASSFFTAPKAPVGPAAICAASFPASVASSASSTTRVSSPHSSASSALRRRLVRISSCARRRPTMRGRK